MRAGNIEKRIERLEALAEQEEQASSLEELLNILLAQADKILASSLQRSPESPAERVAQAIADTYRATNDPRAAVQAAVDGLKAYVEGMDNETA